MNSLRRKIRNFTLILIAIFSSSNQLSAQINNDLYETLENIQENNESENFNLQGRLENLEVLANHPININKASSFQLELTGLFNTRQIISLIEHIASYGKLLSVYELQAVENFSLDHIYSILPYITTAKDIDDPNLNFASLISKGNYEIILRYQQNFPNKVGYSNNSYLGHPSKIYLRYKYNYGNKMSYGITAEKDQGEPMFRYKNKSGFDFYSFHFFWRKNKKLPAIALGDYQVNLGQGLVLWTGFGFNKGLEVNLNKKEGSIIRPFTSVNEYLFLRGFAFTYKKEAFEITPFVSYKKIDANSSYSDSLTNDLASSRIQINGYHRTTQELENKNQVSELKAGTNIQYKKRKWHLSLNFLYTRFSQEIKFDQKAYNTFQFQGTQLINASVDYHYLLKSFHFFGENALSVSHSNLGSAFLNGILFTPNKTVDFSLVHRSYQKNYQTHYYTNSFGELSNPNGEHGIYFGTQIKLSKKLKFSTYFDYYQLPWLRFRTNSPSNGYDYVCQFRYKHSKKFECYFNFKREEKEGNTKLQLGKNEQFQINSGNRSFLEAYFGDLNAIESLKPTSSLSKQDIESATFITPILLHRSRLHISVKPHKNWTFQTRFEYSFYNDKINTPQRGYLFYQDIRFNSIKCPLAFSTRITYFDIAQYNSRIYAYENDVLYQFSVPAMYNSGIRYYLNMNYKLSSWMQIWFKFSTTYYSDIKSKGSGNDEVLSNRNYDIKMQIRWKF